MNWEEKGVLLYSLKRVKRGWRLFTFMFIGIVISTTLFAGTNIGSNQIMSGIINEQISSVKVDMSARGYTNITDDTTINQINSLSHVTHAEQLGIINIITNASSRLSYLIGLQQNSKLQSGITLVRGREPTGVNETVIPIDSTMANNVDIGDTLYLNITWMNYTTYSINSVLYPLKVVGVVSLNDTVKNIFQDVYVIYNSYNSMYISETETPYDFAIVNYDTCLEFAKKEETITKTHDLTIKILIWVDRTYYANPYDIDTSIQRLEQLKSQVGNILSNYDFYVRSDLLAMLQFSSFMISFIKIQLLITSLPIFFMVWYMGTILSNLTYNLRRKEIGLLLTKGFEPSRIRRMFLTEGLIIGILAGVIGIFTGGVASAITIGDEGLTFPASAIGIDTVIITIIAGAIFGIFSVYGPAGRASKMKVLNALREYVYIEEEAPYRDKLAKIALLLGTYKLITWLLGFSVIDIMRNISYSNILLVIAVVIWMFVDMGLSYIGPILFFYGFAKIFIQKSMKFKDKIESFASTIYGELGKLAAKDISRNTARNASVAFILALIIGYSVSSSFYATSNIDFMNRRIYAEVGSDVRIDLVNANNMSYALNNLSKMENVQHVAGVYSTIVGTTYRQARINVVNGTDWLATAYYEDSWFSSSPQELFAQLDSSNSIILERIIAANLELEIGDYIHVDIGHKSVNLKIIGLFGPIPQTQSIGGTTYTFAESTWSFVSWKTINTTVGSSFSADSSYVLVKLNNLENTYSFTDTVKNYTSYVKNINSVKYQKDQLSTSYQYSLNIRVSQLIMLFTMILATLGTFVITQVSLAEKRREIALISVRGLSIRQMAQMLLAETSVIFILSMILGIFVGTIMAYGSVISQAKIFSTLVVHRLVFGLDVLGTIAAFIGAILLCVIIPVLLAARRGSRDFETLR